MRFYKAHGLGNDFIILWEEDAPAGTDWGLTAKKVCERHTGIGADGILLLSPSARGDFFMSVYNSDGSRAEMCGNGVRCAAWAAYLSGRVGETVMTVDTLAGPQIISLTPGRKEALVTVNMGMPGMNADLIGIAGPDKTLLRRSLRIGDGTVEISCVFMGVPHGVIVTSDLSPENVCRLGPMIERHPLFTRGINVDFISPEPDGSLRIRTWERGAGPTLACGTGACASAYLYNRLTGIDQKRVVRPALGDLVIEPRADGIYMTGPARIICEGEIDPELF